MNQKQYKRYFNFFFMEGSSKVNDLIFKELIKRGYSLEGKTRVWNIADSKLWHLSEEQTKAYLNLDNSGRLRKNFYDVELKLIDKYALDIKSMIGDESVNIVDLGCGNGAKAARFINKLKGLKVRYCPVDINSGFVETAIETVRKENPEEVIKMQWVVSDFENVEGIAKLLRYKEYQKNVYLLLGNTLENLEIHETLYQIRRAMNDGDILIIGDGLDTQNKDELLEVYSSEKIEAFLDYIPRGIGFSDKDVEIKQEFNNSRIEIFYNIKVDKTIEFGERTIEFKAGDRLLVFFSYKYDADSMKSFTKMYFDDAEFYTEKDETYALIVCKK